MRKLWQFTVVTTCVVHSFSNNRSDLVAEKALCKELNNDASAMFSNCHLANRTYSVCDCTISLPTVRKIEKVMLTFENLYGASQTGERERLVIVSVIASKEDVSFFISNVIAIFFEKNVIDWM